jgi:hypothetical protein
VTFDGPLRVVWSGGFRFAAAALREAWTAGRQLPTVALNLFPYLITHDVDAADRLAQGRRHIARRLYCVVT